MASPTMPSHADERVAAGCATTLLACARTCSRREQLPMDDAGLGPGPALPNDVRGSAAAGMQPSPPAAAAGVAAATGDAASRLDLRWVGEPSARPSSRGKGCSWTAMGVPWFSSSCSACNTTRRPTSSSREGRRGTALRRGRAGPGDTGATAAAAGCGAAATGGTTPLGRAAAERSTMGSTAGGDVATCGRCSSLWTWRSGSFPGCCQPQPSGAWPSASCTAAAAAAAALTAKLSAAGEAAPGGAAAPGAGRPAPAPGTSCSAARLGGRGSSHTASSSSPGVPTQNGPQACGLGRRSAWPLLAVRLAAGPGAGLHGGARPSASGRAATGTMGGMAAGDTRSTPACCC